MCAAAQHLHVEEASQTKAFGGEAHMHIAVLHSKNSDQRKLTGRVPQAKPNCVQSVHRVICNAVLQPSLS